MRRFLVRVLVNAIALWITALIVSGITVTPYADGAFAAVITYLVVAIIFSVINSTIGTAIRIVAFPLYVLTLGLLALVVNALLLMLVSWISGLLGFGLTVSGFWPGVLAAIVLGFVSWLLALLLRPLAGNPNRTR
ncbi:phage holin family protein [soil metagenome]